MGTTAADAVTADDFSDDWFAGDDTVLDQAPVTVPTIEEHHTPAPAVRNDRRPTLRLPVLGR